MFSAAFYCIFLISSSCLCVDCVYFCMLFLYTSVCTALWSKFADYKRALSIKLTIYYIIYSMTMQKEENGGGHLPNFASAVSFVTLSY